MRKQLQLDFVGFVVITTVVVITAVGAIYAATRPHHTLQNAVIQPHHVQQEKVVETSALTVEPTSVSSLAYQGEDDNRTGVIVGQVLDVEGHPVSGVMVMAANVAFTPTGQLPSAFTDEQGRFRIERLESGTYKLYTEKEEDGYVYSPVAFSNVDPWYAPQASVAEGATAPDVIIHLGPKATKLVVSVVDATTNNPTKNAQLILRRTDNPDWKYTAGGRSGLDSKGRFEILVPPVPFTIEASAPGYKSWRYNKADSGKQAAGLSKHGDALHLAHSENAKELIIALTPDN